MAQHTEEFTSEELGEKLLKSVNEMNSGKASRATQIARNQVSAARLKTGLTQTQFAQALQISPRTLQEWEQGRREPTGAAKALLHIAFNHPGIIKEAFNNS